MSEHGTVHWSELMTNDVEAAKTYYREVCGWTFTEMPMPDGTYHLGMKGETPIAGMFAVAGTQFEGAPPQWMTYFAVDDVDKAVAQTKSAGCDVVQECMDVPGVGRIAIVKDSSGATAGIMTPADNS